MSFIFKHLFIQHSFFQKLSFPGTGQAWQGLEHEKSMVHLGNGKQLLENRKHKGLQISKDQMIGSF